jgi:hypothetical protein
MCKIVEEIGGWRNNYRMRLYFNIFDDIMVVTYIFYYQIFKNGKLVMQLDALERNIHTKTSDAVSILESIGIGTLGTIGASLMVPTLGLSLIPGILIFGTSHYLIKQLGQQSGR